MPKPPKEKPIIFGAESVRSILSGAKTQTRRVAKPQPGWIVEAPEEGFVNQDDKGHLWGRQRYLAGDPENPSVEVDCWVFPAKCPYRVGQRLWVRETWCEYGSINIYRADYDQFTPISDGIGGPWRSPIFMPRWASRLTLQVESVRVERLQDISEADILAEGIQNPIGDLPGFVSPTYYRECFEHLWESINGQKPGCSWAESPWVWVVQFARVA